MANPQKSTPKVRILADTSPEIREKLEEVCHALGITKREFFDDAIEKAHKEHVRKES